MEIYQDQGFSGRIHNPQLELLPAFHQGAVEVADLEVVDQGPALSRALLRHHPPRSGPHSVSPP